MYCNPQTNAHSLMDVPRLARYLSCHLPLRLNRACDLCLLVSSFTLQTSVLSVVHLVPWFSCFCAFWWQFRCLKWSPNRMLKCCESSRVQGCAVPYGEQTRGRQASFRPELRLSALSTLQKVSLHRNPCKTRDVLIN